MSENAKTIGFVLAGLLAISIGVISTPSSSEVDEVTLVGTDLTKNFTSPETAKRLKIVRFDEDTATLRDFEVAEQNGLWSIPSKDGYPADAAKQMAEAATSLMDRTILGIASKNAGDHEQYGVIDPQSPKLEPGQKGVGTRVTMSDEQGKPLVDLILGKSVRNADTQRYVREAGRDVVYIIAIDPAKLSTNFEDWIEKDLLKLNAWDLQQVEVKDYSAEMGLVMGPNGRPQIGVAWDPRADMTLTYNDTDAKWNPVTLKKFDPKQGPKGDYAEFKLADDEELNTDTLNGLKTALDDLKIVDVKRKPQGLSENLKAGESFMNNREALQDLISKGFAATATQPGQSGGQQELISAFGEVVATMKNGVEYVLRFGQLTNVAGQEKQDQAAKDAKEGKADAKSTTPGGKDKDQKSDVHRYMFVMARFNEKAIKQPEIVKLPDLPAGPGDATKDAAAGEAKKDAAAAPKEGEAKNKPEEKKGDAAKPSADAEKKASDAENKAGEEGKKPGEGEKKPGDAEKKPGESASADAAKKDSADAKKEASAPKNDDEAKKDDPAKKQDEAKKEGDAKKQDEAKKEGEPNKDLDKVIAERKQIEQENQRKLDEYQASIKKGQEAVKDLNVRFGDWYFVVDDNVFQKVRVSQDKVIKKKEKKADGAAAPGAAPPPAGIPGLPPIPSATPGAGK
jgi:hypothetical protein